MVFRLVNSANTLSLIRLCYNFENGFLQNKVDGLGWCVMSASPYLSQFK